MYAKFMQYLLDGKHKTKYDENIDLTREFSAIIEHNLSSKLKDSGKFTIPCRIGKLNIGNELCDLGARTNFMPLFVIKLDFGEPKPT